MKKAILYVLFFYLAMDYSMGQDAKVISLSWSWYEAMDSSYSKWEKYSGTCHIAIDSVVMEFSKGGELRQKTTINPQKVLFALSLLKYDILYWQDMEFKIRSRRDCDTIQGMLLTYRVNNSKTSFWITDGCFPDQYREVLTKLFDLFRKHD